MLYKSGLLSLAATKEFEALTVDLFKLKLKNSQFAKEYLLGLLEEDKNIL